MADKHMKLPLPGFWLEDRGLSFFLAFLVIMTIFVPMVGLSRPGRIAVDLTFALMLVSGTIATIRQRMLMYLIIALTILGSIPWNAGLAYAGLRLGRDYAAIEHTFGWFTIPQGNGL